MQKILLKHITMFKSYSTLSKLIFCWFLPHISVRWPKQKKNARSPPEFFDHPV